MSNTTVRAGVRTLATCSLGALRDALTAAGLAIASRPVAPVLASVHVTVSGGRLRVAGTNYDTTVSATVADAQLVDDVDDVFVVNHAELLGHLVAAAKGDTKRVADALPVTFSRQDNTTVVLGVAGFELPMTTGVLSEYPDLPPMPDPARFCEVDLEQLRVLVTRCAAAAGRDQLLPLFTAFNLTLDPAGLHLEATDRYRIACGTVPVAAGQATTSTLVPAKPFATVLAKISGESGFVAALEHTLVLTAGHVSVWLRSLDGEFPKLTAISEPKGSTVTLRRDDFVRAATKAAHLSLKSDPRAALRLELHHDHVTLYPRAWHAEASAGLDVPATTEIGAPFSVGFNPAYLLDMLTTLPAGDTVTLVTAGSGRPGTWYTDDPQAFRHTIMSMRLPVA